MKVNLSFGNTVLFNINFCLSLKVILLHLYFHFTRCVIYGCINAYAFVLLVCIVFVVF